MPFASTDQWGAHTGLVAGTALSGGDAVVPGQRSGNLWMPRALINQAGMQPFDAAATLAAATLAAATLAAATLAAVTGFDSEAGTAVTALGVALRRTGCALPAAEARAPRKETIATESPDTSIARRLIEGI